MNALVASPRGGQRLRIGVDMHVFDGKFQGSRSHLLGVYGALTRMCPEFDFVFFLEQTEALARIEGFDAPNATCVSMPHCGSMKRLAWVLPRLRQRHGIDLLHTQYIMPLWPRRGNVVTVHDVLFESHPQFFGRFFVLRSRLLMRLSTHAAEILLTVSEFSRQEIERRYGRSADRITVTFNAVDRSQFFPGAAGAELVNRRGLVPGNYFLTVGRIEPRKNHANILRAYARLTGAPPPLVIVGQRDFGFEDFERELAALPGDRKVVILSDVGDGELPALYRHAMAFVYPSYAEGFGMPPLEAMASGVPVVSSTGSAIPEVLGDAGLLVDPSSADELTAAMQSLQDDAGLRTRLVERGLQRADVFTWEASATALAGELRRYSMGLAR